MSDEKGSRKAVRTPYSWGLRAANRVEERISVVHNRLGFDPEKSWGLFSLETYLGKMGKLYDYMHSHLVNALGHMGYEDRKAITWTWPLPGDEYPPGSFDSPGILRMIYLPPRTKKPDDLVRLELVDVHSQPTHFVDDCHRLGGRRTKLDGYGFTWSPANTHLASSIFRS